VELEIIPLALRKVSMKIRVPMKIPRFFCGDIPAIIDN